MAVGQFRGFTWGYSELCRLFSTATATTFTMPTINNCIAMRFTAIDTRDIASVYVNYSAVTSANTVELRIETIDATTGKPTGSLYDAAATKVFTPVAGWQIVTFASLPTAGLTAGTEYAVLLITTGTATTQTIRGYMASAGGNPVRALTATDGSTRSNLAEVSNSVPVCTLVMEDAEEVVWGMCPYAVATGNLNISGTLAAANKIVIPTGVTITAVGYYCILTKGGTPAGDLRFRLFTSADAVVTGSTVTLDKDSIVTAASNTFTVPSFPSSTPLSITAGTYRIVMDSSGSSGTTNCWRQVGSTPRSSAVVGSGAIASTTTDVTAGTITWVDDASASQIVLGLRLDDLTAAGGGVNRAALASGLSSLG